MIWTIEQVEEYLGRLPSRTLSYGDRLAHVTAVLSELGDPQDTIPSIHIAGTSGKGSTAYYTAGLLASSGYSVGLSVSPHVSSVMERSQVYSNPLSEAEYCEYFSAFVEILQSRHLNVTYIEFLTVFSYWLFARLKLDYIVIEVGMGGRLDPTNTIHRADKVCVITDIGLDHTEILGNTLKQIANEKAGIIAGGNVVVMNTQPEAVMAVVRAVTNSRHAPLHIVNRSTPARPELAGYQDRNFNLAVESVSLRLQIDGKPSLRPDAQHHAANINIPGRLERFAYKGTSVILDAAHNPQKMTALADFLQGVSQHGPVVGIVSLGKNKITHAKETLEILGNVVSFLIATEFIIDSDDTHQAIPPEQLATLTDIDSISVPNLRDALDKAVALSGAHEQPVTIVVTGSFYLVSNMRELLMQEY